MKKDVSIVVMRRMRPEVVKKIIKVGADANEQNAKPFNLQPPPTRYNQCQACFFRGPSNPLNNLQPPPSSVPTTPQSSNSIQKQRLSDAAT